MDEYLSKEFNPSDYASIYNRNSLSKYIIEYLKSLNEGEILMLLYDLLSYPQFRKMKWDTWNYQWENVKDWREDLLQHLKRCGIEYDFEKRQFKDINNNFNIPIIPFPDLIKKEFSDIFYRDLSDEINKCYRFGCYTAVYVLSRKLIENLLIDILRKRYPDNKENYTNNGKKISGFSTLLKNLKNKKKDFGVDEKIIDEFLKKIGPFKSQANLNTHSIITMGEKSKIDSLEIERIIGLLIRLKESI